MSEQPNIDRAMELNEAILQCHSNGGTWFFLTPKDFTLVVRYCECLLPGNPPRMYGVPLMSTPSGVPSGPHFDAVQLVASVYAGMCGPAILPRKAATHV
jgi:hypothetical protein